jgi:hypothetical protein
MMFIRNQRTICVSLFLIMSSLNVGSAHRQTSISAQRYEPVTSHHHSFHPAEATGDLILENVDGVVACRDARQEESEALTARDDQLPLHLISPAPPSGVASADTGLRIILRATDQLEDFPLAKNAFLRAAETWENLIQSPITVIVDVDYGPLRFGQPYPDSNILGSTTSQKIGSSTAYGEVRSRLVAQASSSRESQIDNALPAGPIQTDIGSTSAIIAPSAIFRALGMISPVADPATEANLGRPPAIGFNSAFGFDFDPSDGIDLDKTDFDAVAVHELGHGLGFVSNVGTLESNPSSALSPSLLDLFRLRPGASLASFPNSPRVQSSGGTQVFFFGPSELALSTGRPDGSAGDGRQASHWKDDDLLGEHLGIMDPTIPRGTRFTITENDLLAFDAMGFQVRSPGGDTVALGSGIPQRGSISAPSAGDAVVASTQYSVQIPIGATELQVSLSGNQDVDLYVRFNQRIAPNSSGRPVVDYASESPTGVESLSITPASSPQLKAGTYYVAVANYGPGAANFEVVANITGGSAGNTPPRITNLQADLNGDELLLTGTVVDPDGDIIQAQSDLLDSAGGKVGATDPFPVTFGNLTTISFTLEISNLNSLPAAMLASLSFIDRRGNRSPAVTGDFSKADAGGSTIKAVGYNGSKMTIKGTGLAGQVEIEINGEVVFNDFSATGGKVKIKGAPNRLNIRSGFNRLRLYNGGARSNLVVFEF